MLWLNIACNVLVCGKGKWTLITNLFVDPWQRTDILLVSCSVDAPLRLYLPLGVETPNTDLIFANSSLFRRRRFKIGAAWRSCSGTLPEGETPSGRPSIAMDASRMCRELSPLDHGSITSSYVMYLSLICASTFESSWAASHDQGIYVISVVAMLSLLRSDGLWDYVQIVMSNIFGSSLLYFVLK